MSEESEAPERIPTLIFYLMPLRFKDLMAAKVALIVITQIREKFCNTRIREEPDSEWIAHPAANDMKTLVAR